MPSKVMVNKLPAMMLLVPRLNVSLRKKLRGDAAGYGWMKLTSSYRIDLSRTDLYCQVPETKGICQ